MITTTYDNVQLLDGTIPPNEKFEDFKNLKGIKKFYDYI